MNVDTKAKVLLKFSSLQTMRVDRRSKKLLESGTLQIHVKHAWEHVHSLTQLTFKHHYEKKYTMCYGYRITDTINGHSHTDRDINHINYYSKL